MRLNDLLRLPEKIPCDKRIHALVGMVVASVLLSIGVPILWVCGVLLGIAWGIEAYQLKTGNGVYDNWDAVAVVLGGVAVMLPMIL